LMQRVQILLTPTVGFATPTIEECGQSWLDIDGKKISPQDPRGGADSFTTIPFNVTGFPALSVPCGFNRANTPVGLQIAAAPFQEEVLFAVAHAYEQATDWHMKRPKLDG